MQYRYARPMQGCCELLRAAAQLLQREGAFEILVFETLQLKTTRRLQSNNQQKPYAQLSAALHCSTAPARRVFSMTVEVLAAAGSWNPETAPAHTRPTTAENFMIIRCGSGLTSRSAAVAVNPVHSANCLATPLTACCYC
eukprot:13680-Heterococcus_DN1.PRE.3